MWHKLQSHHRSNWETRSPSSVHFSPRTKKAVLSVPVTAVCTGSKVDQEKTIQVSFIEMSLIETAWMIQRDAASTICPKPYRTSLILGLTTVLSPHVEWYCLVKDLKWTQVSTVSNILNSFTHLKTGRLNLISRLVFGWVICRSQHKPTLIEIILKS